MVWFKVDDKLHDHPKAWKAGAHAIGLWTLAGSWCGDNLTDGFVPDYVVARWDKAYKRLAARLVDAGLFTVTTRDGVPGWQFHDWNAPGMQPTSAKVKADRQAAADRQARARDRARESRQESQPQSRRDSPVTHTGSHGPPDPTRPDQERGTRATSARPSPFCHRHPQGTGHPCTACANARRAHDTWTTPTPTPPTVAQRLAEVRALDTPMEDTA